MSFFHHQQVEKFSAVAMDVPQDVEGDRQFFLLNVQPGGRRFLDWCVSRTLTLSGRGSRDWMNVSDGQVDESRLCRLEDLGDVFDTHTVEEDTVVGLDVSVLAQFLLDFINTVTAKRLDEHNSREF